MTQLIGMSKRIAIIFLALFSITCVSNEQDRYEGNFKKYLSEVHHTIVPIEGVMTYYVINVNECEDCIDIHLYSISNHKFRTPVTVVIVGEVIKTDWINRIQDFENRKDVLLYDDKGKGMVYDTGLQKPITMKFVDGSLVEIIQIKDQDIQKTVSSL